MPATKEQERKALQQIRKIVKDLGTDSYIALAFDGCFEIAEENIENDFGCSMKQRALSAERKLEEVERVNRELVDKVDSLQDKIAALEKKALSIEDLMFTKDMLNTIGNQASQAANDAANRIVEYADRPDSEQFRNAVAEQRRTKSLAQRAFELETRICAILSF